MLYVLLVCLSIIILIVCFSCSLYFAGLPVCCSEGENYEKILVRKLLEDYDTAVRPSRNITVPLNVTFGLALTQIIDVVRDFFFYKTQFSEYIQGCGQVAHIKWYDFFVEKRSAQSNWVICQV